MQTRKLKDAFPHADRLAHYLTGRGWEGADELTTILEKANRKIEEIERKAIADVLARLEGFYTVEARTWASDQRMDTLGNHVRTPRVKQRKSMMEFKRIERTIEKLRNL